MNDGPVVGAMYQRSAKETVYIYPRPQIGTSLSYKVIEIVQGGQLIVILDSLVSLPSSVLILTPKGMVGRMTWNGDLWEMVRKCWT